MKYTLAGWIRIINHYHTSYFVLSAVPGGPYCAGTLCLAGVCHQSLVMIGAEPSLFSLTGAKWGQTTLLALYGLMTEPQGPRVLAYPG